MFPLAWPAIVIIMGIEAMDDDIHVPLSCFQICFLNLRLVILLNQQKSTDVKVRMISSSLWCFEECNIQCRSDFSKTTSNISHGSSFN